MWHIGCGLVWCECLPASWHFGSFIFYIQSLSVPQPRAGDSFLPENECPFLHHTHLSVSATLPYRLWGFGFWKVADLSASALSPQLSRSQRFCSSRCSGIMVSGHSVWLWSPVRPHSMLPSLGRWSQAGWIVVKWGIHFQPLWRLRAPTRSLCTGSWTPGLDE